MSFRAGVVLVVLILAVTVLSALSGIANLDAPKKQVLMKSTWELLQASFLSTLQLVTFESKPEYMPISGFLKVAGKLLIPIQAALFALAVRTRFRR